MGKPELQKRFEFHLKKAKQKNASTIKSDAFYLWNNGKQAKFVELLRMVDCAKFIEAATAVLQPTLVKYSKAKGKNISSYKQAITLLWDYLHSDNADTEELLSLLSDAPILGN